MLVFPVSEKPLPTFGIKNVTAKRFKAGNSKTLLSGSNCRCNYSLWLMTGYKVSQPTQKY